MRLKASCLHSKNSAEFAGNPQSGPGRLQAFPILGSQARLEELTEIAMGQTEKEASLRQDASFTDEFYGNATLLRLSLILQVPCAARSGQLDQCPCWGVPEFATESSSAAFRWF